MSGTTSSAARNALLAIRALFVLVTMFGALAACAKSSDSPEPLGGDPTSLVNDNQTDEVEPDEVEPDENEGNEHEKGENERDEREADENEPDDNEAGDDESGGEGSDDSGSGND